MSFAQDATRLSLQEWERFDRGKGRETDPPYRDYVKEYWVSIGVHHLDGATEEATPWDPAKTWRPPWSAAFISWIARKAGAGDRFAYGPGHAGYVARAWNETEDNKPGRLYQVRRIEDYTPQAGDLVHFSRTASVKNFQAAKALWADGKHYNSHCDFVVEADPGGAFIQTIGGNTRDSQGAAGHTVGRKRIRLSADGKLNQRQSSHWLAIMECLDR
ncbi:DUF2272 domain-containing protein [Maricaulis salignorans]|uniref:DUF2272 domain-containing protein n=1 Tax=Maricaulis salignorans TaxID=144026 RepID=UPI003A8F3A5A